MYMQRTLKVTEWQWCLSKIGIRQPTYQFLSHFILPSATFWSCLVEAEMCKHADGILLDSFQSRVGRRWWEPLNIGLMSGRQAHHRRKDSRLKMVETHLNLVQLLHALPLPGFALLEREISEFPWMSNLAHLSTIPIEANIHSWSTVWKACTRKRTLRSIKAAVEAGKTGLNDGKDWRLESSGVNCGHVRISVPNGQTLSDTDPSVLYFHCSTMGQGKQAPCSSVGNRSRLGYDAGWRCGDDTLDSLDLQYPKLLRDV